MGKDLNHFLPGWLDMACASCVMAHFFNYLNRAAAICLCVIKGVEVDNLV